jgi:uncharacterized protein (DUF1697 family)
MTAFGSGDDHPVNHYASVLRAVNVGGARSVKMAELRRVYESLGLRNVESYVQSGNVVFSSDSDDRARVAQEIASAVADTFGLEDVDILIRTRTDLEQLVRDNPFLDQGVDPSTLHVTFLAATPSPARLADVDASAYAPDAFAPGPEAVYLHCPNGYGRTKLNNAFFERALGVRATTRNWRTVNKLLDLVTRREEGAG